MTSHEKSLTSVLSPPLLTSQILEKDLKAVLKPQYVDRIPATVKGQVGKFLQARNQRGKLEQLAKDLDLAHLMER